MSKNRIKTNVMEVKATGVAQEILERQQGVFSLAFFGYDSTKGESVVPYIEAGIKFLTEVGYGQIYIPPTSSNNYPVFIKRIQGRTMYEMWGTRFPMNDETRPYTEDRFQMGDVIHNTNPPEEGVMGWVCYQDSADSNTGEWRAWGELKRFCSEAQKVDNLPIPQMEREGQVVMYQGRILICVQSSVDDSWYWDRFVFEEEFNSLTGRVDSLETSSTDLLNRIISLESGLDWRETVETFADLATTYSEAEDGWTVNVKDTDITYRFDGENWIPISSNSIPLASSTLDGKMSKEDKVKLDGLVQGYCMVALNGTVVSTSGRKILNLTPSNVALKFEHGSETAAQYNLKISPDKIAYCKLSEASTVLQSLISNANIAEVNILVDTPQSAIAITISKAIRKFLRIRLVGALTADQEFNVTVTGTTNCYLDLVADNTGVYMASFNIVSGSITIVRAESVAVENKTTTAFALRELSNGKYKGGNIAISTAINSDITINSGNVAGLGSLFGCRLSVTFGENCSYYFTGSGNTIYGIDYVEGSYIECPLDTIVDESSNVHQGSVRLNIAEAYGTVEVLPKIDLANISLGYIAKGGVFRALITKSADGSAVDALGNVWTVVYLDATEVALTAEEIMALDLNIIGTVDLTNERVLVPRPIPNIWVGPSASVPASEDRDADKLYFVY